ncbi:hypothetical protein BD560DRAFT_491956 [Blakeslea trispora]|nr:hypothetical protein BD560DRAFT_491956 [Blakeslea trispora]
MSGLKQNITKSYKIFETLTLSSTKEVQQGNSSDCKLVRLQIRNESGSDNQANRTFCEHDDNKMTFFSYDNRVIRGPLEYINHKDAVFNAFFKIDRIQQLCRRRKLFFAHHLHLLPGGKYVRILGIKEKAPMKQTADVTGQKRQYNIPESTWQDILNEHEKDNETLRQEIDELLGNTNRLSKQLKNRFKEFSDQDFSLQIKTAKQGWRTPLNLEPEVAVVQGSDSEEKAGLCCPQIGECMTAHVRRLYANNDEEMITAARNEIKVYIDGLKADRSRLFLAIQQVKSELADQDQKASRQTRVLQQIMGQPTIAKDEDMQLMGDADTIAKNSTSSGTDNGVVKMTESLPVSIQKYVYHLKLYNRFSALTTTEEQEEEFQPLPSSAVINAEDIDFGSQNLNYRHKLAAKKANDVNLIEAEKVLSEKSSRIKQHLRYGGIWKQDLHASSSYKRKANKLYRNMKGAFHCLAVGKLSMLSLKPSVPPTLISIAKQHPSVQEAVYWLHAKPDEQGFSFKGSYEHLIPMVNAMLLSYLLTSFQSLFVCVHSNACSNLSI